MPSAAWPWFFGPCSLGRAYAENEVFRKAALDPSRRLPCTALLGARGCASRGHSSGASAAPGAASGSGRLRTARRPGAPRRLQQAPLIRKIRSRLRRAPCPRTFGPLTGAAAVTNGLRRARPVAAPGLDRWAEARSERASAIFLESLAVAASAVEAIASVTLLAERRLTGGAVEVDCGPVTPRPIHG